MGFYVWADVAGDAACALVWWNMHVPHGTRIAHGLRASLVLSALFNSKS